MKIYEDTLLTLYLGDCIEVMRELPEASVDAVVTDPPYGLEFMGKEWDKFVPANRRKPEWDGRRRNGAGEKWEGTVTNRGDGKPGGPSFSVDSHYKPNTKCLTCGKWQFDKNRCRCKKPDWEYRIRHEAPTQYLAFQAWCTSWATEALRVTKPGGYLLAFGGTRTHHRLVCGLEDAGWIIRDELTWIYACLSDDTEVLTNEGWVPYNRASEATHAAAFDTDTGKLRWERIAAVHQYDHEGPMVRYGPALTTLNHRVVLSPESEVPLPSDAELHRLWGELRNLGSKPSGTSQDVLPRVLAEAVVHASRSEAAGGSQGSLVLMRDVREADVETRRMGQAHHRADVLLPVQRQATTAVSDVPAGDTGGLDRGELGELSREDERPEQPSLEGRSYRVQEARELLWGALRARAGLGVADGSQGRVRDGAPVADGDSHGLPAHPDGVRQPREPRPDRQPPREPEPLAGQPDPQAVRVGQGDRGHGLPPGDTPRLVDYAGVVWCITVPSGAFVARRNGIAFVTGNSGFPKGKANLKPAHEPIVLARKPGPLQPLGIDAGRIPSEPLAERKAGFSDSPVYGTGPDFTYKPGAGRWPSNVLLSDPELFDQPNDEVVGSGATATTGGDVFTTRQGAFGGEWTGEGPQFHSYGDTGGYSRFFILPKADRRDREPVLRGQLPAEPGRWGGTIQDARPHMAEGYEFKPKPRENGHPTVKPVDLMRHLVRLVTPLGGTVLDCFLGSGSTALAANAEGFRCIGIEQSAEYLDIAMARLLHHEIGLGLEVAAPTRKGGGKQHGRPPLESDRQPDLIWRSYQPEGEVPA